MPDMGFRHLPVLAKETLALLAPVSGEIYLDGTLGGGGHSRLILEASAPTGRLIGLDRDQDALLHAAEVLAPYGGRVTLRHACYADADRILDELGVAGIDGALLDLGVSSWQLDAPQRGFSFRSDAPLDMRMDQSQGITAAEVVNTLTATELTHIFRDYGEERWASRIARQLVRRREQEPWRTTGELAEMVRDTVPGGHIPARIHPATRVFQALRIYVNDELGQVRQGLDRLFQRLRPGGRLVVISFHSLEDRIVKRAFQALTKSCHCPPGLPVCICGDTAAAEALTRRGILGSDHDSDNPRARSAVLRAIRKRSNPERQ